GRDHAVHQLEDSRGPQPVRQRAVPVARDHHRQAALPQLAERGNRVGEGRELERAEHGPPRGGEVELRKLERAPHLLGAPIAQPLQPLRVRAVQMMVQVVGDLGHEAGLRLLLGHVEPRLAQEPLEPRRRRLQLDESAERVEQDGARRGHEIQCQLAYWAVNRPSPTADAATTRSVTRRSSDTAASHMKIGNSTLTNRGSDISGCGVTGNVSGRTSEAATHTPYALGSRLNTPTQAATA